jgi:ectoine hydroxylase-related dioxygenase (phytanoyl-CoA dioxygenase family)
MSLSKKKYINDIKKNGFTIVPSVLSKKEVINLKRIVVNYYTIDEKRKNPSYLQHKNKDKNVYNLQNKNYYFIKILSKKVIENIAKYFLNDPYYQFLPDNKPNYILKYYNARSSINKLDLHIDSYMPFKGDQTYMMQFVFLLDESTLNNGCTFVVKRSHKSGKFCDRNSKNLKNLIANPGDLIIWDSRLWHGAYENKNKNSRWALVATLSRWFIKQSTDITRGLPKNIYKKCTNKEKLLLGFCSLPPRDEFHGVNTKANYSILK